MKALIEIGKSIIDGLTAVWSFISGFFEFMINGISSVFSFVSNIPAPFIYGVTIAFFVSITMLIVKLVGAVL